jgi:transposase InsO family protein
VIDSLTGQGINVRHACRVLGVSESGYYDWKGRPAPPRTLRRIWLAGEIADVHKASGGTYGYQRVTAELRYGREIVVGHNTVGKIMSEIGLKGLPTRRLPKGARMAQVTSRDLVRRVLRSDGPNQLWMTDITEHPTREGKVYCCVVLDAFYGASSAGRSKAPRPLFWSPTRWGWPPTAATAPTASSYIVIAACNSPPGPSATRSAMPASPFDGSRRQRL